MTRWFDKDGNEIFHPKRKPEELTHLCEFGGDFERCRVSLSYYSTKLNKEEITSSLGVLPTKAWNPNERHPVGNGKSGKTKIEDWGKWIFDGPETESDPNELIEELLRRCTNEIKIWDHLGEKYEGTLALVLYAKNWNREFVLSQSTMKKLADRNLRFWVDAYFEDDEEQTTEQIGGHNSGAVPPPCDTSTLSYSYGFRRKD